MKKNLFVLIYFAFLSSVSAQSLVEKDSMYYLFDGRNTFPAHKYVSVKLYRYFVSDQYISGTLTTEQLFEKGKWSEEDKKKYLHAYKKVKKETKSMKDLPWYIQQRAIEMMFGLSYKSEKEILRDSLVLTGENLKKIFISLSDSGMAQEYEPTKCTYEFRHQLVFFDEKGKECDRIKFCLFCAKIIPSSYIRINDEIKTIKKLRKHFKDLGVKITEFGYQVWDD